MTQTNTDVTVILTADHREMMELVSEIENASSKDRRRDLADTLIAEVMRHAVAEEMYVYPAMEKHVPEGAKEVTHDKREHSEIVRTMKEIEREDAGSAAFMGLVRKLGEQLAHHAKDEEADQFPSLRAHLPREKLVELGQQVETAKKLAPTRPHPHAPHSELFHKTVGPGVGMVDRLLDKLTGRQTDAH